MLMVFRDDDGSVLEFDELGEGKIRIRQQDGLTRKVGETLVNAQNYELVHNLMVKGHELIVAFRPPMENGQSDTHPD